MKNAFVEQSINAEIHEIQAVEVIRIVLRVGSGSTDDPVRLVEQYWSKDGRPIGPTLKSK